MIIVSIFLMPKHSKTLYCLHLTSPKRRQYSTLCQNVPTVQHVFRFRCFRLGGVAMRKRRNHIPLLYGPSKNASKIVYPWVNRHSWCNAKTQKSYSPIVRAREECVQNLQNRIPLMVMKANMRILELAYSPNGNKVWGMSKSSTPVVFWGQHRH